MIVSNSQIDILFKANRTRSVSVGCDQRSGDVTLGFMSNLKQFNRDCRSSSNCE